MSLETEAWSPETRSWSLLHSQSLSWLLGNSSCCVGPKKPTMFIVVSVLVLFVSHVGAEQPKLQPTQRDPLVAAVGFGLESVVALVAHEER